MTAAQQAFRAFTWFLWQCSIVGGLGARFFWIPAVCLSAFLVISFRKSPLSVRKRFWWLAVLPANWIAVGLWGGYFWLDTSQNGYHHNPPWVSWPVTWGFLLFIASAVVLIIYLRRGRSFAALFAAVNFYFMYAMTVMAGMAISGVWL